MNQSDFAALGGVGRATQINYEKDERSPDANYLSGVATAGVDVLYVLTGVRLASASEPLTADESALLHQYKLSNDENRETVRRVAQALATYEAAQGRRS